VVEGNAYQFGIQKRNGGTEMKEGYNPPGKLRAWHMLAAMAALVLIGFLIGQIV
jgi:hypothetical protein